MMNSPEELHAVMSRAEDAAMEIFESFESNEDSLILPRIVGLMMCAVAYLERLEGSPQRAQTLAPLMLAAVLRDHAISRGLSDTSH